MSDGDNATPGFPHPSDGLGQRTGDHDDSQWLTRSARPSPAAAPWERATRASTDPEADRASGGDEPTGNHTDGVTVADLIARLTGGGATPRPRRRRADDDAEPPAERTDSENTEVENTEVEATAVLPQLVESPAIDFPDDADPDTEVMAAAGPGGDLPDLAALERAGPARIGGPGPAARTPAKRRGRRRVVIAGRSAAALLAVLALVLTGGAWQWQSVKNNRLNKVSALDPNSRDIVDPNAQFGDENFLIVGVDSRIGENSDMGAGTTADAAGARSDTVMLVNIPASRKRVVAVSFPRDLAITPIKCEPWNPRTGEYGPIWDEDTQSYGPDEVYTETKLNSAYAFGGPKCLVKVIQKLSGLSINRFMAVDFAGFAKMVDALGGVEVCSTTPLKDYELGTVLPHAGRQIVDGKTALNYVRARMVTTENNGDYGRIKRQQRFLSSLLRSMISKEVFFSLRKLNNVVNMFIDDSYVDNIKTKDLVELGQSIQGVSAGRITFLTVPTTGQTDSNGNEPPRVDDMRAMFDAIINDDPLPGEKNPDNTPVPQTPTSTKTPPAPGGGETIDAVTTDPADVTVRVSNSTGENGLAASTASALQQYGFNITTPDDYSGSLKSTTVLFAPGNEQAAATVASAFTNPTIERVSGMNDVVRVVLGSDFSSVGTPRPSGSSVQVHVLPSNDNLHAELPEDLTVTNAADTSCD